MYSLIPLLDRIRGAAAGRAQDTAGGAVTSDSKLQKSTRPVRVIVVSGLLLIGAIISATGFLLFNLRDRAITDTGRELRNLALVLAEQTTRTFQAVDLVENNFIDKLHFLQVTNAEEFQRLASGNEAFVTLRNMASSLPQLDAIALVDANGSIINSSRARPLSTVDLSERDYFVTLKSSAVQTSVISAPTYNSVTGLWTIYIARSIRGFDGQFLGMVSGGIQLRYFEELYQRVSLGEDSSIALLRNDGMMMVRYPRVDSRIGKSVAANPLAGVLISKANVGAVRLTSLIDGKDRIFAAHRLENYPVVLSVGTTVAVALANWRNGALYTIGAAVLLILVSGGITVFSARQIAAKLRAHNLVLNTALNNMSQGLIMFDGAAELVLCNHRYMQMYDLPPDRVRTCRTLRDVLQVRREVGSFSGDPEQFPKGLRETISQGKSGEHVTHLKDGRSIKVINEPMDGGGWVSTHDDITERQLAENELRRVRKFLDTIIENVPIPIVVKTADERRYTLLNRSAEKFFSISRAEMIGKTAHDVYRNDRAEIVTMRDDEAIGSKQALTFSEHVIPFPDGDIRRVKATKVTVGGEDGAPRYLISLLDDVTEKAEQERRIAYLAHHDVLTDLPNRAFFNETLAATITQAAIGDEYFAVMCIDLDGFKEINDVYGHSVGDALLRQFSNRMSTLGEGAFLARLGGDEFTFIVPDDANMTTSSALSKRLLDAVTDDFEIDGYRLRIGLSMGIAMHPTHGSDAKTLMNNADAALYRAKAEGRGSARFFEPEMGLRLRERLALQEDLRFAVERNEFFLHYQPQVKMSGRTIGFEALVRWQNHKRGMVSPADFIPVAEESGLIIALGEWVLREACREAASWPTPMQIAVNISPVQFRSGDLPGLVHAILLETGLAPARLELEITEGVLIDDFSRAVSILRRLTSLGVKIALDDFGTGYSSLSYLHSFPFDKIKIDRTFIANVQHSRHSAAIVRAVIGLGRSLDIPILAEGVETEAQRLHLEDEGCDEMQGYLTGRPLPIDDYAERIGRAPLARIASTAS